MLKKILIGLCLCFSTVAYATSTQEIRIAGGVISGAYYPVALQLCNLITKYSPITKCEVIATSGSINNINLLATDKVDFAFSQSDVARDALKGVGVFSNQKPYTDLRQVMSLFSEVFTMIVKDEKGITNFSDVSNKTIGLNLKGSGAKSGLMNLFKYFKFDKEPQIVHVPDAQMASKLCDNEIDIAVLFTGHPSGIANQIASTCDVEFISVDPLRLDNLIVENPVYEKHVLPAKLYPTISRNAFSFATRALLVTNRDTNAAKVNLITSIINKHFEEFKALYPVLNAMQKDQVFKATSLPSYFQ